MTHLRYTQLYLVMFLVAAAISVLSIHLPASYLMIALALAVTILGLPHGALDFAVAKSLRLVDTRRLAGYFIGIYIVFSGLSIGLWLLYPVIGLALFLMISVYHFSTDWRDKMPAYARLSLATVLLCGPAVFYADTLMTLFTALLLSPAGAAAIIQAMLLFFGVGMLVFLYFISRLIKNKSRISPWLYAESIVLIISSLVLSPLLHFALYFCLLHSPKHLQDVSDHLDISVRKSIIISLPFVLLTLILAVAIFRVTGISALDVTLLRAIFIGLFGLTMSHMLLISLWHHAQQPQSV